MNEHDYTPWWDPDAPAQAPQETPAAPAQAPETAECASTPQRHPLRARLLHWAGENFHTVLFMAIGLLVALCMLAFGFWRTLLVVLLVGTGYVYGSWRDGNPRLLARIRRFYERWINGNPFMK